MANQPIQTQVAVLKEQTNTLHSDLSEMKGDIKQIKEILLKNFVTIDEFRAYKRTQNAQKIYLTLITAFFTSILTYELVNFLKG
jgi:uncharacterized coiled-coil DUF342 family protein